MKVKEIRLALSGHPHIKKVWVNNEGYHTFKVHGAVEVDLTAPNTNDVESVESIAENVETEVPNEASNEVNKPTKRKKK